LEWGGSGSNLVLFFSLSLAIFPTRLDATVLVGNLTMFTGDLKIALPDATTTKRAVALQVHKDLPTTWMHF
jgi:hypothetical protein